MEHNVDDDFIRNIFDFINTDDIDLATIPKEFDGKITIDITGYIEDVLLDIK